MLALGKKFLKKLRFFQTRHRFAGHARYGRWKNFRNFRHQGLPGHRRNKKEETKKTPPPIWKTAKILIFVVRMVRMQDAAGDTEDSVLDGRAEAEAQQTGRYGYKETTSFLRQAWQEPPAGLQGCPQYRTRW